MNLMFEISDVVDDDLMLALPLNLFLHLVFTHSTHHPPLILLPLLFVVYV
jgi:hypothetical protein